MVAIPIGISSLAMIAVQPDGARVPACTASWLNTLAWSKQSTHCVPVSSLANSLESWLVYNYPKYSYRFGLQKGVALRTPTYKVTLL